jgi:hypothetical protein
MTPSGMPFLTHSANLKMRGISVVQGGTERIMASKTPLFKILIIIFGFQTLTACGSQALNQARITPTDEEVEIQSEPGNSLSPGFSIRHLASVSALRVDAQTELQATQFDFFEKSIVVVSNLAGPEVYGALEVIDLSDPREPKAVSKIEFKDAEFADVKVFKDLAYAVGGDGVNGAVLKVISLSALAEPKEVASVSLEGFYGTSLEISDDFIWVTTGDNRGIQKLKRESLELIEEWELPYATFVKESGGELLVSGGKSFGIHSLSDESSSLHPIVQLSDQPEDAPSRFAVKDGIIFANPSSAGLVILKYEMGSRSGAKIMSQTPVKGRGNGLDYFEEFVFLAQGDAGVQVYAVNNFEKPEHLGFLDYPNNPGSANQVKLGKLKSSGEDQEWSVLLVADGRGGFQILRFEKELSLEASKFYSPSTLWQDASVSMFGSLKYVLPKSIAVIEGSSGNHWVSFFFDEVQCRYRGSASTSNPLPGSSEWNRGNRYDFLWCRLGGESGADVGLRPGDIFEVNEFVRLSVAHGARSSPTRVQMKLVMAPAL